MGLIILNYLFAQSAKFEMQILSFDVLQHIVSLTNVKYQRLLRLINFQSLHAIHKQKFCEYLHHLGHIGLAS